jgi:hypothetical protein
MTLKLGVFKCYSAILRGLTKLFLDNIIRHGIVADRLNHPTSSQVQTYHYPDCTFHPHPPSVSNSMFFRTWFMKDAIMMKYFIADIPGPLTRFPHTAILLRQYTATSPATAAINHNSIGSSRYHLRCNLGCLRHIPGTFFHNQPKCTIWQPQHLSRAWLVRQVD